MANTTFQGPVRSENGFTSITKNSTTGAITTDFTINNTGLLATPVALADADVTLSPATHGGRVLMVPALASNRTITIGAPTAGLYYKIIYIGAAEEAENLIIKSGSDTNFFKGCIIHADSNADNVSIYADGDSNSKLTLTDFGCTEINLLGIDSTNWAIWGISQGEDAPVFANN